MLRPLLEWTGGFAGVGVVVGLLAVGVWGAQRGALPDFGGDEWLSQLVKLGLMCGVLVAVLVAPAAVDGWIYRTGWMADDPPRPGQPLAWRQLTHAARQGVMMFAICSIWGAVIAFRPLPVILGVFGIPALMVVFAIVVAALHHVARRSGAPVSPLPDRFDRFERWFNRHGLGVLPQALLLLSIAMLLPLIDDRVRQWTPWSALAAFVVYGALTGVLSAVAILSARPVPGAVWTRLATVGILSLAIAGLMAPELVRLAGLGNLPRARLLLEPAQACEVERHLAAADRTATPCAGGDGLRLVEADIVSRLGAHYTLAPAGALAAQPAGRCASAPAARFPCLDLPRDAVKLLLR